jgi:SAM-dependent MidA family methyltransferase
MPVHRFLRTHDAILESAIGLNLEDNTLIEQFLPSTNKMLVDYVTKHIPADWAPYQSEVNLLLPGWLIQCSAMLKAGVVLLIDYGFPRAEFYHPDRNQGTLMCHAEHRTHPNVLTHVGEQDLTAHVDFTHVAEAAEAAGFHIAGYTNQAAFLLGAGLPQLLEQMTDEHGRIQAIQAVKQLLQPQEMGELFKIIALSKHCDLPLAGFAMHDKRGSL